MRMLLIALAAALVVTIIHPNAWCQAPSGGKPHIQTSAASTRR